MNVVDTGVLEGSLCCIDRRDGEPTAKSLEEKDLVSKIYISIILSFNMLLISNQTSISCNTFND